MAIDIQTFQQSAALQKNRTVHLSRASSQLRTGRTSKFGRIISWFRGFRSSQNQAVRNQFVASLKETYGVHITSRVAGRFELNSEQTLRRPLTSFVIRDAIQDAETYARNYAKTCELADSYPLGAISKKIKEASQNGKYLVTAQQAADIAGQFFEDEEDPGYASDEVLNNLRNKGLLISSPRRLNRSGQGNFSNAVVEKFLWKIENETEPSEMTEGVSQQMLRDVERSHYSLNGEHFDQCQESEWIQAFKKFCTDKDGTVNEDMMFGISQIAHQGVMAPFITSFKHKTLAPFREIPLLHSGTVSAHYQLTKDSEGGVSLRVEYETNPLKSYIDTKEVTNRKGETYLSADDVKFLDPNKSRVKLSIEVYFDKNNFSSDRTQFVVPEVKEASYEYSLYPQSN